MNYVRTGIPVAYQSRMSLCVAAVFVLVAPPGFAQNKSVPVEVPLVSVYGTVGKVIFRETMSGGLNIDVQITYFGRGEHAVHIHQNPVCDGPDFKSAGTHFNPEMKLHGWENPKGHHAGDLPENLLIDGDNNGHLNVTVHKLNMTPGSTYSVLNRSIIVHEHADDMKTDPTGDSGNRIACAVIQVPE